MWGKFNPKPEHASAEMRKYARQLLDKLIPRLPSEPIGVWIIVPAEFTRGQVKELGLEVREIYSGEIYASCCFENKSEHFGSSDAVLWNNERSNGVVS